MKRDVKFIGGYDCIRFECCHGSPNCAPGKGGSHGVHGMDITFSLSGNDGAVVFCIFTNALPIKRIESEIGSVDAEVDCRLSPADLMYHSNRPLHEGQKSFKEVCEHTGGTPCYCDGSSINAHDAMYSLLNGGDEALWDFMEGYYEHIFNGCEYPKRKEYKFKPRNTEETTK